MILEIGNTRCKFLEGSLINYASYSNLSILKNRLSQLPNNTTIYYSSVNSSKLDLILQLVEKKRQNFTNIRSLISATSVRNIDDCYNIGADRLFGALGAKKHSNNDILSIDCGTATTINYLTADNIFKGGVIFPGYMMQQHSLQTKTAIRNTKLSTQSSSLSLPTSEAIHSGIVLNTCGAIQLALNEIITREQKIPTIVLTGGNYHYFSSKLSEIGILHKFDPFLVLRGIVSVLPENLQTMYTVKW